MCGGAAPGSSRRGPRSRRTLEGGNGRCRPTYSLPRMSTSESNNKFKFTESSVQKRCLPGARDSVGSTTTLYAAFWDTELRGFGIFVRKKASTFVFQRDLRGQSVKVRAPASPRGACSRPCDTFGAARSHSEHDRRQAVRQEAAQMCLGDHSRLLSSLWEQYGSDRYANRFASCWPGCPHARLGGRRSPPSADDHRA